MMFWFSKYLPNIKTYPNIIISHMFFQFMLMNYDKSPITTLRRWSFASSAPLSTCLGRRNCRGDPMKSSMGKSHESQWDYLMLVGGLEHVLFSISYMGCHPSHWRTHIFQDGYCTTNQNGLVMSCKSHWKWENPTYLLRKISNGLVFPGRFTGFLPEYFMGKSWKIPWVSGEDFP